MHYVVWGGAGNCIKVYPRGQVAEIHLHFDTVAHPHQYDIIFWQ